MHLDLLDSSSFTSIEKLVVRDDLVGLRYAFDLIQLAISEGIVAEAEGGGLFGLDCVDELVGARRLGGRFIDKLPDGSVMREVYADVF